MLNITCLGFVFVEVHVPHVQIHILILYLCCRKAVLSTRIYKVQYGLLISIEFLQIIQIFDHSLQSQISLMTKNQ